MNARTLNSYIISKMYWEFWILMKCDSSKKYQGHKVTEGDEQITLNKNSFCMLSKSLYDQENALDQLQDLLVQVFQGFYELLNHK